MRWNHTDSFIEPCCFMIQHKTFFSFSPLQWNAYNFLNFLSRVNCCNASKHHWLIRCIHNILHSAENHRGVMKLLYHARILLLLLFFSYLGQLIEYVINRWMQRFKFLHDVINIPRRVSFKKATSAAMLLWIKMSVMVGFSNAQFVVWSL